ncbi:hypothetical protein VNI00_009370 [Paramarasmius palmivorus]|uniref:Uncharacterized protein n=1 Tax=Paramarasmius palmivorus TaxID=297713 RepID=A0AAW0CRK8_9AGAR
MIMCLRQATTYGQNAPTTRELNLELRLASNVLMRLNFLLGDIIVVWRTWVVWWDSIQVKLILSACMLGTTGAIVGNGTKAALDLVRETPASNTYSLVLTLPPLITNIAATLLIALKVCGDSRTMEISQPLHFGHEHTSSSPLETAFDTSCVEREQASSERERKARSMSVKNEEHI